jgi:hypothetical protein
MKVKEIYNPPTLKVYKVVLEESVAGNPVSVEARLYDWEDGGELGTVPEDGGDIYLYFWKYKCGKILINVPYICCIGGIAVLFLCDLTLSNTSNTFAIGNSMRYVHY